MNKSKGLVVFAIMAAVVAAAVGLLAGDDGKVPITTSSDAAMEQYLKGRDMADRLRNLEARDYFMKAVKADPGFAMAHLNLSLVSATASEFFEEFNKARALVDKISEGEQKWILGFEAGAINGDPATQLKYYKELVGMYPNDERAHNLLGGYHFGIQDYPAAIEAYEMAATINPEFSQPLNQLGYAYRFMSDFENAEKTFKRYTELIPDDPNPYDSYAELLLKMGSFDKSIEKYREALEIQPTFIFSYLGIASCLSYQGKHELAQKELDKMYKLAAHDGQRRTALFGKAVCYHDAGNNEMALETLRGQYKVAEAIDDTSAMTGDLNQMAYVLREDGQLDKSAEYYDKSKEMMNASSLDDNVKEQAHLGYLYNMARIDIARGDVDAARARQTEYSKHAHAVNNAFQIRLSHEMAGMIALAEGEHQKAIDELAQANQQNPYNHYRIGLCYEGLGQKDKAQTSFSQAANWNQPNFYLYASIRSKAGEKSMSM